MSGIPAVKTAYQPSGISAPGAVFTIMKNAAVAFFIGSGIMVVGLVIMKSTHFVVGLIMILLPVLPVAAAMQNVADKVEATRCRNPRTFILGAGVVLLVGSLLNAAAIWYLGYFRYLSMILVTAISPILAIIGVPYFVKGHPYCEKCGVYMQNQVSRSWRISDWYEVRQAFQRGTFQDVRHKPQANTKEKLVLELDTCPGCGDGYAHLLLKGTVNKKKYTNHCIFSKAFAAEELEAMLTAVNAR